MVSCLEQMFPIDLEGQIAQCPLLVLPIGTIEWHSHHLPVGLDGLVAEGIAARLAESTGGVLAPTSYWAVGGVPFPWTLNLPATLIEPLLVDGFKQMGAMGFRLIVALTGHFGRDHTAALKRAACTAMADGVLAVLPVTPYELISDQYTGDHAGPGEASMLAALHPTLVRLDAVPPHAPLPGVIGDDPRGRTSAAWGEALIGALVSRAVTLCEQLLTADVAQRADYLAAMQSSTAIFDAINRLRATAPPAAVPPLMTPLWHAHCAAFATGDWRAMSAAAAARLDDLWA